MIPGILPGIFNLSVDNNKTLVYNVHKERDEQHKLVKFEVERNADLGFENQIAYQLVNLEKQGGWLWKTEELI